MHISIGIDKKVLVRDAIKATTLALAFCSSVASTIPRIFFWLGQINTHTLKSIMVPNHAPTPINAMLSVNVNAATTPEPSPPCRISSAAAPVNQVKTDDQRNTQHSSRDLVTIVRHVEFTNHDRFAPESLRDRSGLSPASSPIICSSAVRPI